MATPGRAFLLVFFLHLGVQGLILTRVPTEWVRPHARFEITAVAMSLHERGAFADPYCLPTGPTAHVPPFAPALLAAVYRLLGPTLAAGYVTWLILVAFHGAMFGMLPWLGVRLGLGPRPGLAAGLVGALLPRLPGYVEALAAVAIGLMMIVFLRRWTSAGASASGSLALGLAIGLSLHVSPSLLPVALGLVAFELAWLRRPRRLRWAALTLLGTALACVPWTWRNHRALGGLFFIRSNFGLELRMGTDQAAGAFPDLSARGVAWRHPRTSEEEARKVQRLGELEYMGQAGREAAAWIRAHPLAFVQATGERVARFWLAPVDDPRLVPGTVLVALLAALGARRAWPVLGAPQRAALLVPLLTYPLVYYVVAFDPRYRRPLDGLVMLLAAVPFFAPRPLERRGWPRRRLQSRGSRPGGGRSDGTLVSRRKDELRVLRSSWPDCPLLRSCRTRSLQELAPGRWCAPCPPRRRRCLCNPDLLLANNRRSHATSALHVPVCRWCGVRGILDASTGPGCAAGATTRLGPFAPKRA